MIEQGMPPLAGKVAVVTGASSGIGRAMTAALTGAGASVVAVGRSAARLAAVADATPGTVGFLVADVQDPATGQTMVDAALQAFGRLDIVVANAGLYLSGNIWETDLVAAQELIATNVSGVVNTVAAAAKHLRAVGAGDIVVTSSISGHQAIAWEPVYSASKHAVQSLVHGVRRQLLGSGVRVGSLAPGMVLNELWGITDPAQIAAKADAGTGLRSEDVAEALLFMLTRPRHVAIRDLVMLPQEQDL